MTDKTISEEILELKKEVVKRFSNYPTTSDEYNNFHLIDVLLNKTKQKATENVFDEIESEISKWEKEYETTKHEGWKRTSKNRVEAYEALLSKLEQKFVTKPKVKLKMSKPSKVLIIGSGPITGERKQLEADFG